MIILRVKTMRFAGLKTANLACTSEYGFIKNFCLTKVFNAVVASLLYLIYGMAEIVFLIHFWFCKYQKV